MSDNYSFDDLTEKVKSFFNQNAKASDPMSYQSLVTRRKIAEALMGKRSPFPKDIGEGLTYLGESLGNRWQLQQLDAAERAQEIEDKKTGEKSTALAFPTPPREPAPDYGTRVPGATLRPPEEEDTPTIQAPPPSSISPPPPPPVAPRPAPPPPPTAAASGFMGDRAGNIGELAPDMLLREGRQRGEPVPLPLGTVPPVGQRPAIQPQSSLGDPRSGIARAMLARQGVVPLDPTQPRASATPSTTVTATPTATDEDDPLTAMAQGIGDLNPMIRSEIERMPEPGPVARAPLSPLPEIRGITPPLKSNPRPVPPSRIPPSPEEMEAFRLSQSTSNPIQKAHWEAALTQLRAERTAENARKVDQFKVEDAYWKQNELANQAAALERQSPKYLADLEKERYALNEAEQKRQDQARFGAVGAAGTLKAVEESYKDARQLPAAIDAITTAKKMLENGTFTGPLSRAELNLSRLRVLAGGAPDPRITRTEQFQATLNGIIGSMQSNMAKGNPSNKDMELMLSMVGGDTKFTKEAALKILHRLETVAVQDAIQHQHSVTLAGGADPTDQFNRFNLPMEKMIPQSYINGFKQELQTKDPNTIANEFNDYFHTPGLVKKLLRSGRLD